MFDKLKSTLMSTANRVAYGRPPEGGPTSLEQLTLRRLDGSVLPLDELAGKVVLFVNVASRCGLTPQYGGLAELARRYRDRGLVIVGTPCNQFLGQEPGSAQEIATFCSTTYGVDFPLLDKQEVNGAGRSPLYQWLIGSRVGGGADISWNFEKFLVGRDGQVRARFAPATKPEAPELVAALEAALAAP
jgi:glutathione peroxidase